MFVVWCLTTNICHLLLLLLITCRLSVVACCVLSVDVAATVAVLDMSVAVAAARRRCPNRG